MGKMITFPPERFASGEQLTVAGMKDDTDRMIMSRILLENVRTWIADDTSEELVNFGFGPAQSPKLTAEQIEELDQAGAGAFGHTTVIEPYDLDLYQKYMYPPLRMPKKPEIMISYWDMNETPVNFIEGRVMVKACTGHKQNPLENGNSLATSTTHFPRCP